MYNENECEFMNIPKQIADFTQRNSRNKCQELETENQIINNILLHEKHHYDKYPQKVFCVLSILYKKYVMDNFIFNIFF